MRLTTPKHRAILWALANFSWIALSPAAALYYDRQLRRGAYPVDADSIGLPIMGIAMSVVALLLPLNFAWWFLLRRYPGRVPLRTSVKGAGTRQRLIGLLGLILAILCSAAAAEALREDAREFAPVFLAWSYVALAMRSAYLAPSFGSNSSLA
jgi:hypothetical protein